jgi:hypothetical protein
MTWDLTGVNERDSLTVRGVGPKRSWNVRQLRSGARRATTASKLTVAEWMDDADAMVLKGPGTSTPFHSFLCVHRHGVEPA